MSSINNNNNGESYCFDKTEFCREKEVASVEDTEYMEGLSVWLKFGLTKEQYDATIEYEKNCKIFNQYLDELNEESGEDPVFIQELEAKIKAFQDAYETKQEADAKADDENDWWIDQSLKEDKYEKPYVFEEDENDSWIDQSLEKPDYDEAEWRADCADHMIEYYRTRSTADDRSKEEDEEWKENYAEKMLEFARQDAIDDYNDF